MNLINELYLIDNKILSVLQIYYELNERPISELSVIELIRIIGENSIISEYLYAHFHMENKLLKQYYEL
jgi:hypothetical protein